MGSFNHKCNFSQLPARCGDRIVVMVGLRPTTGGVLYADTFSPGNSFTPVSVPIRGEYNDYGSIENVDRTPGVEALEKYFGMSVDKIVDCAERITCDCEDQVKADAKKIMSVLCQNYAWEYHKNEHLKFSYIMEHEAVFDSMISMSNIAIKDKYYWRIPHKFIESLGYTKNLLGKDNHYEVVRWTHDTLPELKEKCYVWKKEDFDDYGKTSHTISELCEYIGCDVPDEYNKNYYESRFLAGIEELKTQKDEMDFLRPNKDEYSFLRGSEFGLFGRCYESKGISGFIICSLGDYNAHMDVKYMREIIEVALILDSLYMLQMTWGNTNYYSQDIDYDLHINFLKSCLKVAEEKKHQCDEE